MCVCVCAHVCGGACDVIEKGMMKTQIVTDKDKDTDKRRTEVGRNTGDCFDGHYTVSFNEGSVVG